jgi:hypothetical protein
MNLKIHFGAMIERFWRCNWRLKLSELKDALEGHDWASLEINWEAVIERLWRCTLSL